MTNRFMISVAAVALMAGAGFANAQGMSKEGSSGGSTVQQSAPQAGSGGAMSHESSESARPSDTKASPGMKATQSEDKSGMKSTQSEDKSGMKNSQSDEKMSPGGKNMKGEKSAQDSDMKGQKSKSMSSENDNARDNAKGGAKDMKAEGRDSRNGSETKGAEGKSETTIGQAGAGAKLSGEQRTKITTVIRSQHVEPLKNVNFSISVGTRVPHDVRFHALPAEVVTVYPEWRGYEFILVNDQIVVIDPRTFEIVAVLEA
jgi:Protein of unknown function (DUF1236)